MCEHGPRIKFCTCDPSNIDLDYPHWTLYREIGQERMQIVGSFLPPEIPSVINQITIEAISDALNSEGSFDFSYEAQVNDQFYLRVSEELYFTFTCEQIYEEGGKTSWRYDLDSFFLEADFKQICVGRLERP